MRLWPFVVAVLAAAPQSPIAVTAASQSVQPGEIVVLSIRPASPTTDVRVRAFGHDLRPFRESTETWRVLVGIDLDVAPGTYTASIEAGPISQPIKSTYRLLVRAKQFPTRRLTVDDAFVNPPDAVLARIAAEAKELDGLYAASAPERLWKGAFTAPVSEPANSAFGTRSVFNGQPRSPHAGADFPSPLGTPVHAPNAGRVVLAKELYYTGNTVVVDHGLGLVSLFAHFSEIDVRTGDRVMTGQIIGKVGATGRVTGPHLHWGLRAGAARVDPLSLLSLLGSAKD